MARSQLVKVSALNIKIHPHNSDLYVEMLEKAVEQRQVRKLRGDNYIVFANAERERHNEDLYLTGEMYKFLNIDPSHPWLDVERFEEIEIDEDTPPPVSGNLKPNLKKIPFLFVASKHLLLFDTRHLSPNMASKGVAAILSDPTIVDAYGEVDVNLVTSREQVERMLRVPIKRQIAIDITVPNPDDLSEQEEEVMDRFRQEQARRAKVEKTAHPEGSLEPDSQTKAMMSLASSNGKATVIGRDESGNRIEESTSDHPLNIPFEMPDGGSVAGTLRRVASNFLNRFSQK